jgi:hypothetical protein
MYPSIGACAGDLGADELCSNEVQSTPLNACIYACSSACVEMMLNACSHCHGTAARTPTTAGLHWMAACDCDTSTSLGVTVYVNGSLIIDMSTSALLWLWLSK